MSPPSSATAPTARGLSSWSIRHPVPTVVLFLALTLAGAVGFTGLRTNNLPDIDLPTVTVTVLQPGAAPSELETQVTRIVEDALAGTSNVDHITSTVDEGASTTTVQFLIGTNIDRAANDVRNAVASVQARLPVVAQLPVIQRVEATSAPIATYVVEAPGRTLEGRSRLVDDTIAKALLAAKGVSKVTRAGGVDRAMRVRLDPDRMLALGLTAAKVSQALVGINVDQPGGRMTIGSREQTVRTVGGAPSVEALGEVAVPLVDGTGVRLREIARVEDATAEQRQRARLDGREVVAFSVYRAQGSSEVDVTAAVRRAVHRLNRSTPGVRMVEVTSSTGFVEDAYRASTETLWIGALLAVGIVWLFLRDWRATLVSAIALPLSLIPTFAVMDWFDVSLNTISLLALSLVVGILIDDAIVEIENIVRHMRHSGIGAYSAAIEAADEIGLAVVATTGTLLAVFLPVAFMPGIPGRIFASFALATCVSVFFSLAVARMLTPLLGAYLLKSDQAEEATPAWIPVYLRLLRLAMRHRAVTLLLGVAFFAGAVVLATRLPSDFLVAADRGRSVATVELAPGATLEDSDRAVLAMTNILRRHSEVTGVYAAEGTSTQGNIGQADNTGAVRSSTLTINLRPRRQRKLSEQALEAVFAKELAAVAGTRIRFGADGQSGARVTVTLVGDDARALSRAAEELRGQMRGVPGLADPTSTSSLAKPEIAIVPDAARAAQLGISTAAIAQAINVATIGDSDQSLAKFDLPDRQVSIVVSLEEGTRGDLDVLRELPLAGTTATVPLGAVAEVRFATGPNEITRSDRRRSISVEASLEGLTLGQAVAAVAALPVMRHLPAGVAELKNGDGGHLQELMRGFAIAIATGILLMYLTLVLLFSRFLQPLTILVALPLSLGGAMSLLFLCGYALSITALIGLLMLMGIAAKNSILLVDYAMTAMRDNGVDCTRALLDAAAKRARPIVMTSVAMGAGMLPIALGFGADAESRSPMAVAVIGGLISSTVLSLVYVPLIFGLVHSLEDKLGRLLSRLLPGDVANGPATADGHDA